jgi:hypothetical protein
MLEKVLPDVPYRQWVLSLPKALRVHFRFDSELFKGLSRIIVDELTQFMRAVTDQEDLEPGFVVWDQTFKTLPDAYHPHPHICATDGGFLPDGRFVLLSRVSGREVEMLCEVLRHRVLEWLTRRGKLSSELHKCLLGWKHSGFSMDASRRVQAGCRNQLEDLLLYMSRHPFATGGIHYDPVSDTVHYQSARKHVGRKTDVISTDAVEFIFWLSQHIPHARKHQVRFYGALTATVRARLGLSGKPVGLKIPARTAARGIKSWARQIWRAFGIDPQICEKCGGEREIISVILRDDVIVKILEHVGLPSRFPSLKRARGPPAEAAGSSATRSLLTPNQPDSGFFADPDYSEYDCIDEQPDCDENLLHPRVESKEALPPKSLLELVEYFPGKQLCWASDLMEENKDTDS